MKSKIDLLSPKTVILTLISIFSLFNIIGLITGKITTNQLIYRNENITILGIYLISSVFLIISQRNHKKTFHSIEKTPQRVKKINFTLLGMLILTLSGIIQYYLLIYANTSLSDAINYSMLYRLALTKDTNGIIYLGHQTPLLLTSIVFTFYIFSLREKYTLLQHLLFITIFIAGIFYCLISGMRSTFLFFIVPIAIAWHTQYKKISFNYFIIGIALFLFISGFLGAYRFGYSIEESLEMTGDMLIARFDMLTPYLSVMDKILASPPSESYGYFYLSALLSIIPSFLFPNGKPLTLEGFLNYHYMDTSADTGSDFTSIAEFYINFGVAGIFIQLLIVYFIMKYITQHYNLIKHNLYSASIYSFLILMPFNILYVSGISTYGIIRIPYIIALIFLISRFIIKQK